MQVELVLDCRNQHGEGARSNVRDQRVWWTDTERRRLCSYAPADGEYGHFNDLDCCFAPRTRRGFSLAYTNRVALTDAAGREVKNLTGFEPGHLDIRPNHGRTEQQGRLVASGMNEGAGPADSTVTRVDPDGPVATRTESVVAPTRPASTRTGSLSETSGALKKRS